MHYRPSAIVLAFLARAWSNRNGWRHANYRNRRNLRAPALGPHGYQYHQQLTVNVLKGVHLCAIAHSSSLSQSY